MTGNSIFIIPEQRGTRTQLHPAVCFHSCLHGSLEEWLSREHQACGHLAPNPWSGFQQPWHQEALPVPRAALQPLRSQDLLMLLRDLAPISPSVACAHTLACSNREQSGSAAH